MQMALNRNNFLASFVSIRWKYAFNDTTVWALRLIGHIAYINNIS